MALVFHVATVIVILSLILLPILLIAYNAIVKRRSQSHP